MIAPKKTELSKLPIGKWVIASYLGFHAAAPTLCLLAPAKKKLL